MGGPYLSPMMGARARAATVKVMPREMAQEFDRPHSWFNLAKKQLTNHNSKTGI